MHRKRRVLTNLFKEDVSRRGFYFVAEVGQNHQGSLSHFKRLIKAAKDSGASAVKSAKRCLMLMPNHIADMDYKNNNSFGDTYIKHREALELSIDEVRVACDYAHGLGLHFGMSFTDRQSIEDLSVVDLDFYKVPSSQVTNIKALEFLSSQNKPVILSTGMSNSEMVYDAIKALKESCSCVMHCVSSYPCEIENSNLNKINTLKKLFTKGPVGFSGHHIGYKIDSLAIALGASVIERHITLSNDSIGSDHEISIQTSDLSDYIGNLEIAYKSLGSGVVAIQEFERKAMSKLRW